MTLRRPTSVRRRFLGYVFPSRFHHGKLVVRKVFLSLKDFFFSETPSLSRFVRRVVSLVCWSASTNELALLASLV
jgi:hypothetical protein